MVWFKNNIPTWAFILWFACWNTFSTKDRLSSWGLQVDPLCPLCSQALETHDHLFLACSYSEQVWSQVPSRFFNRHSPAIWSSELTWDSQKLIKEEPQNSSKDPTTVFKAISSDIQGRVCSWDSVVCSQESVASCTALNLSSKMLIRPSSSFV